jgi:hypothetical protein
MRKSLAGSVYIIPVLLFCQPSWALCIAPGVRTVRALQIFRVPPRVRPLLRGVTPFKLRVNVRVGPPHPHSTQVQVHYPAALAIACTIGATPFLHGQRHPVFSQQYKGGYSRALR